MIKRRFVFIASVLLILSIGVMGIIPVRNDASMRVSANIRSACRVIIDCGHGGEDGGAVAADGTMEKDLNLTIGLYLRQFLVQSGFDVVMIRDDDTAIYDSDAVTLREKKKSDLLNRTELVNNSDENVLISIHQNKFSDSKYYGTQVFYSKNHRESKMLAEDIRLSVKGLIQSGNERQCKEATSEIYLLSNVFVPAVLVECGFLSNTNELSRLVDSKYQKQLAYSVYAGFLQFYYNKYN